MPKSEPGYTTHDTQRLAVAPRHKLCPIGLALSEPRSQTLIENRVTRSQGCNFLAMNHRFAKEEMTVSPLAIHR